MDPIDYKMICVVGPGSNRILQCEWAEPMRQTLIHAAFFLTCLKLSA
jgi:hypothetical protein